MFSSIRCFHDFFFKAPKDFLPRNHHLLLDYLNPDYSIYTVCIQYVASLADGRNKHLVLLWRWAGFRTIEEWAEKKPEQYDLLMCLSFMLAISFKRRHKKTAQEGLFEVLSLSDLRVDLALRQEKLASLETRARKCCVGSVAAYLLTVYIIDFGPQCIMLLQSLAGIRPQRQLHG